MAQAVGRGVRRHLTFTDDDARKVARALGLSVDAAALSEDAAPSAADAAALKRLQEVVKDSIEPYVLSLVDAFPATPWITKDGPSASRPAVRAGAARAKRCASGWTIATLGCIPFALIKAASQTHTTRAAGEPAQARQLAIGNKVVVLNEATGVAAVRGESVGRQVAQQGPSTRLRQRCASQQRLHRGRSCCKDADSVVVRPR